MRRKKNIKEIKILKNFSSLGFKAKTKGKKLYFKSNEKLTIDPLEIQFLKKVLLHKISIILFQDAKLRPCEQRPTPILKLPCVARSLCSW